jgi:hypothetical protein
MNNALHRIHIDLDFLALWTLANAFGFAVGELIVVFFGGIIYVFSALVFSESAVKTIGETLARITTVAPLGLCMGLSQWLALRHRLKKPEWWFVATLIGYIFAGVLLWEVEKTGYGGDIGVIGFSGTTTNWLIVGAIIGVAPGLLQMLILPLHSYTKLLWPLLNGFGWAIGLGLGRLLINPYDLLFSVMVGAFGGIFTGIFMQLLPIRSDKETGYFVSTSS